MGQDNQKTILKIVKEPHDKDHIFACLNRAAADAALKNIGPSAFAMWYYFAANNEERPRWELSFQHVSKTIGPSRGVYDRAIHTLIEKGYLVAQVNPENEVANEWIFYEVPQRARADTFNENKDTSNENKDTFNENNNSLSLKYNKSLRERKKDFNENKKTNNTYNTLQNKDITLYSGDGAPPQMDYSRISVSKEARLLGF